MTDDRHISDADAAAIADAASGRTAAGRLEAGKSALNDALRSDRATKRERTNARVLGRVNQPAPTVGEDE
jgi:hypothetical protein